MPCSWVPLKIINLFPKAIKLTASIKQILLFNVLTVLFGIVSIWLTGQFTEARLKDRVLEQAVIVEQAINKERLGKLKGNREDISSPDYIRLKQQLFQIRSSHKTCRFLYLMGRKSSGTVFFFLDSHMPDDKDYAPPGLVYDEVPGEYLSAFDAGQPQVVGPITDRWGCLVTALVPIFNSENKLMAMLGMDFNSDEWNKIILLQSLLPASLTLFIVMLITFVSYLNYNRSVCKQQYEKERKTAAALQKALAEVKTLNGMLPICASCKKIRDDKGYWNQIESYIQKHSQADFSHSLCPECAKRLYPEYYKGK